MSVTVIIHSFIYQITKICDQSTISSAEVTIWSANTMHGPSSKLLQTRQQIPPVLVAVQILFLLQLPLCVVAEAAAVPGPVGIQSSGACGRVFAYKTRQRDAYSYGLISIVHPPTLGGTMDLMVLLSVVGRVPQVNYHHHSHSHLPFPLRKLCYAI